MTGQPTEGEIQQAADSVYSRWEFRRYRPQEKTEQREMTEPPPRLPSPATNGFEHLPQIILIAFIVLAVAALVTLIVRTVLSRRKTLAQPTEDFSDDPWSCDDPWGFAERLAQEERYNAALVLLFVAYLRMLGEQGLIVTHKSKTNLQYEWELMQSGYELLPQFRAFKTAFHDVRYGGYTIDGDVYGEWKHFCTAHSGKEGAA